MLFHVMNEGTINVLGESTLSTLQRLADPLEHYFELSKPDAQRALSIYRTFVKQTELVVQYLSLARSHEHSTRLEIPKIKHAPTSLANALEEYLNDKDFEINRRQYLAEKEAKKSGGKPINGANKLPSEPRPTPTTASQPASPRKPSINAPLIDLFESIQDNQQTMASPQYTQQTGFQQATNMQMPPQTANVGFAPQPQPQAFSPQSPPGANPFAQMQQPMQPMQQPIQQPIQQPMLQPMQQSQLQPQFTGAGFGGYTPQPFSPQSSLAAIPQNGVSSFQQQQMQQMPTIAEPMQPQPTSTNPFRQSMLPPMPSTGIAEPKLLANPSGVTSPLGRSPTNPFAKNSTGFQAPTSPPNASPFSMPQIQSPPSTSPFAQQQPAQPLPSHTSAPTGTNPFARNASPQGVSLQQGGLTVHATGSTNPFRQSAFVNQQTGQGWQNNMQGTIGGMSMDQVPTQGVFPRPGQQQTPNFLG